MYCTISTILPSSVMLNFLIVFIRISSVNCDHSETHQLGRTCLRFEFRCDGVIDCDDAMDEFDCRIGHETNCLAGQFECHDKRACVRLVHTCDGHRDCLDGSDESPRQCERAKVLGWNLNSMNGRHHSFAYSSSADSHKTRHCVRTSSLMTLIILINCIVISVLSNL